MSYSITIHENEIVVMYNGYKPVGAATGNSNFIEIFIEQCSIENGNMKIYGEHRLIAMKNRELEKLKNQICCVNGDVYV